LNLGHSNILFIKGIPYIDFLKERFNGYKKALKGKGIKFNSEDFTMKTGYSSVKKCLDEYGLNFSAIFAVNNQIAIGAVKTLNDKGIVVAKQLSIVGFDDSHISLYIIPQLKFTAIKQRREEMGKISTELLLVLDRISSCDNKKKTPRQIIIPVELIERESAISISSGQRG